MYMYLYIHICIYLSLYIFGYVHLYTIFWEYIYMYMYMICILASTYRTHIYIYVYIYIHVFTHIYIYVHIYIYICIHSQIISAIRTKLENMLAICTFSWYISFHRIPFKEKAGSRGAALQVPNLPLAGMALDMTSDIGNASAANSAMLNIFPPPLGLAAEGMAPSMGGVAYVNASSQYPPRGMSLDPRGLPIGQLVRIYMWWLYGYY